mmetsp:Transcript_28539/g.78395  ORF Transcript_28539/g.78395 Transcript_28539/m.78395 type:complete len:212 (-) Transcript_28539:254-889(-)
MRVSGFMVPADKVHAVDPKDTIENAMDLMLQHGVGAVVVVENPDESFHTMPLGIITKTDLIQAYHDKKSIRTPVQDLLRLKMGGGDDATLKTCTETMNRDEAAKILEHNKMHHALVVDHKDPTRFVGLISSWDITVECAKDDRAWPWNRHEDGRVHGPHDNDDTAAMASSPTSTTQTPQQHGADHHHSKMGDSFRQYVDDLAVGTTPYFGD